MYNAKVVYVFTRLVTINVCIRRGISDHDCKVVVPCELSVLSIISEVYEVMRCSFFVNRIVFYMIEVI